MKRDSLAEIADRGDDLGMMEPMILAEGSRFRGELTDLALELVGRSAAFRRSLPAGIVAGLAISFVQ
jgi:hypothetical protein